MTATMGIRVQVVEHALNDYFTKKKSRLSAPLMKGLLKERPSRQAAEALTGYYSGARNAFLKAEVVQLLQTLMHPVKVGALMMPSASCITFWHFTVQYTYNIAQQMCPGVAASPVAFAT